MKEELGSSETSVLTRATRRNIPEDTILYLILPAALGPGVYSASKRNEYQKLKNNVSGELGSGRCLGLAALQPSLSRLSRQCGILNILQSYRPPRPVSGIALFYFYNKPSCVYKEFCGIKPLPLNDLLYIVHFREFKYIENIE
jgi:hypothetical protein